MNFVKYILVPCLTDRQGKFMMENRRPPYGFHHILGFYTEPNQAWLMATVYGSHSQQKAEEVMNVLAGDTPTEIDPDFYKKDFMIC